MNKIKHFITLITLFFFVNATLYEITITNLYSKERLKRNYSKSVELKEKVDPYASLSDEAFLQMAQKDYETALRYAMHEGIINSESEFLEYLSELKYVEPMDEEQKKALKRNGINPNPSYYIGETRYKKLLEQGIDLNKGDVFNSIDAGEIIKQSLRKDKVKPEEANINALKLFFDFLIKEAFAETTARQSRVTRTNQRIVRTTNTRADTTNTTQNDTITRDNDYDRGPDEEDLQALEDLYSQERVNDTWDKTKAAEDTGNKETSGKKKSKQCMAAMLITLGIIAILTGLWLLNNPCPKEAQTACSVKPAMRPACCAKFQCDPTCSKYLADNQTGWMLLLAGVALLLWGVNTLGQAKEIGDEEAEQNRKNREIEAARKRQMQQEYERRDAQEKIIKYRMRKKQEQEQREGERIRQLQNAAQSGR